jgi:hypothetical protein
MLAVLFGWFYVVSYEDGSGKAAVSCTPRAAWNAIYGGRKVSNRQAEAVGVYYSRLCASSN